VKGRTVEEAMKLIADAIRYTFQYHEADYSRHVLADIALLQRSSDLVRLRNFWPGDQYKGISSLWRDRDTGQLFEVQFHSEHSYEVMLFTAERSYARLRSARTCAQEEIDLEAFQREVYARVPVPPGAHDIPGYPDRGDWEIPGRRTHHGIMPNGSAITRPSMTSAAENDQQACSGAVTSTTADATRRSPRNWYGIVARCLCQPSAVIWRMSSSRSPRKRPAASWTTSGSP
jgi:hypothetical protein